MKEIKNQVDIMNTQMNILKLEITKAYDAIHDVSQRFTVIRKHFLNIKSELDSERESSGNIKSGVFTSNKEIF